MTEQEKIELNIAKAELQNALVGLRAHNATVRRERDAVPAHLIMTLAQTSARLETLLTPPAEAPKPKTYRSM